MLGNFERGQTIDCAVTFVSQVTGQLIDPLDPTIEIVHYDGTTEIVDIPETALVKVPSRPVGYYTYEFVIPSSFILNEMYFIRWRGEDPNSCTPGTRDVIEETFRVVSSTGTGATGGDCCCLVPRFTSC